MEQQGNFYYFRINLFIVDFNFFKTNFLVIENFKEYTLSHHTQNYDWDCGLSAVLMVVGESITEEFLRSFREICKAENFEKR